MARLSPAVFALLPVVVAACMAGETPPPAAPAAPPPSAAPAPTAPASASAEPAASAVVPARPGRPPPPAATAAMVGSPAPGELAAARLEKLACTDLDGIAQRRAEAEVVRMRERVDAEFQSWHDAQMDCWEEYRRRAAEAADGAGYGSSAGHGGGSVGYGYGYGRGGAAARPAVRLGASSAPKKAGSASGTNVQVAGVDEADLVKTDGTWVYFAVNGALRIVEAMKPRLVSTTKLRGFVKEMFIEGNRAVVYASLGRGARKRCTYGYDCTFAGDGSSTVVTVLDVTDRAAPKVVRTLELSGSLIAARRIGNAVHTVVADGDTRAPTYPVWPEGMETCGVKEQEVRRRFKALKRENEQRIRADARALLPSITEGGRTTALCDNALRAAGHTEDAFTSVVSFDLTRDTEAPVTATIQSRPGAVFASTDALYFSVVLPGAQATRPKGGAPAPGKPSVGRAWFPEARELSAVHKFRLGEVPTATQYVGSGVVPGHVLNQFSMDQWEGYLRVATSIGKVPNPNVSSSVSVLRETETGELVRVGAVDGLAPSEDIRAVRFDDDRAYVVTFKKTDPLFVLDLWDPAAPKVLGELKIPGFSTYIHRIDPDHLLSIGFDADDKGNFAYFDGIILQLFDVSRPTEPRLLHKEKLGTRGSTSEAATDHLAFNYFGERGLLAFPMTLCEGGGDGKYGGNLAFSGLYVYTVDVEKGFTRLGGIDHGKSGVSCSSWWSRASSLVKRSVILDDLVYSVALDRTKVQRIGAFGVDVADIPLR